MPSLLSPQMYLIYCKCSYWLESEPVKLQMIVFPGSYSPLSVRTLQYPHWLAGDKLAFSLTQGIANLLSAP